MTEDWVRLIARICHEANRAYCDKIGDLSQPHWEDAPEWQRLSAIEGVRSILDGRVTTPRQSHEQWLAHKLKEGWTVGPVKDAAARTHPCCVPYDELPAVQRMKDEIFNRITTSLGQAFALMGENTHV